MAPIKFIPTLVCLLVLSGIAHSMPTHTLERPHLGSQVEAYFAHKIAPFLVAYGNASITKTQPPDPSILHEILRDASSHYQLDVECNVCKDVVQAMDALIHTDNAVGQIITAAADLCKSLKVEDDLVCDYIVREYIDEVIAVLTMHYLNPDQVCGTLLGESCAKPYDYMADWNLTFPGVPKPPVTPVNPPKPGAPKLRILHITDLHVDLMYKAGMSADCGEPICCRSNNGPPKPNTKGAGTWGDLRGCDVPTNLLVNALEDMSKNHKFDFIYMTGDLPAHDVWNQTRADNLHVFDVVTDLLMKYFPGVKLYGALGNHESAPCNSFPPTDVITGIQSVMWLYDVVARTWIDKTNWLPNSTRDTILRGGYYEQLIYPGLRLVSLNMNAGAALNWWLQINATDPDGQLQWLVDLLQRSETAGEKVHILGHYPPGETMSVWSKNYELIVKRYESTIRGQFFGHTHKDEFEIFYENVTTRRPINIAYVAGAITPSKQNPGYRIYSVDGNYKNSTLAVLDHENYYLNLTEANLTNKPTWRLEYTAKKSYNMTSLQPSEWDRILQRFKKDTDFFNLYYTHYHRLYDDGPCDASCRSKMLCKIETARGGDHSYC